MRIYLFCLIFIGSLVPVYAGPPAAAAQAPSKFQDIAWNKLETYGLGGKKYAQFVTSLSTAKGRWQRFKHLADDRSLPLLSRRLARWLYLTHNPHASFAELKGFIDTHPTWPTVASLIARAETADMKAYSPGIVVDWFHKHPPQSLDGKWSYLEALEATESHPSPLQEQLVQDIWLSYPFDKALQRSFYTSYRRFIPQAMVDKRFTQLFCSAESTQLRRIDYLSGILSPAHKTVWHHYQELIKHPSRFYAARESLPPAVKQDRCMQLLEVKTYANAKMDKAAQALLLANAEGTKGNQAWWRQKHIQLRHLLRDKHYQKAYKLASNHGMTTGIDFAEGEELAGWIALRYLKDPVRAQAHFETLLAGVKMPGSKTAASYWLGRSHEAQSHTEQAAVAYRDAARHPETFYGILANEKLGITRLPPGASPVHTPESIAATLHHPQLQMAVMLIKAGFREDAKRLLSDLIIKTKNVEAAHLIASLPKHFQQLPLSLSLAKQASYGGVLFWDLAYPRLNNLPPFSFKHYVLFSIIRQESLFDYKALSVAGATGLMQIHPPTGQELARKLKTPFKKANLYNPAFNMELGSEYLRQQWERYNGCRVRIFAAYNAGPTHANRWTEWFGDPAGMKTPEEVIDWIQSITYRETRGYVQNLLANMQVYRALMHPEDPAPLHLHDDLLCPSTPYSR